MPLSLRRLAATTVVFVMLAVVASAAWAHKASDAYLQIDRSADGIALRWDIALRDLDAVLDLDANADQQLTWGEVRSRLGDIQSYALQALRLQQGRCALAEAQPAAIEKRIDGMYLVLRMQSRCDTGQALDIDYRLFRDVDPTHRGLLRLQGAEAAGAAPVLRSLDPSAGNVRVDWPDASAAAGRSAGTASAATAAVASTTTEGAGSQGLSFFQDGIHHILIGYDHVLFLICLLLPAVLRRDAGSARPGVSSRPGPGGQLADGWLPVVTWQAAAWPMLGIVTMFTIAHSLTLALAGLKVVTLSPRIVEPGIAITIILAALDNIHPVLRGRRKLFAFLFGLIHGFGFAGALGELDLPLRQFVLALLQFNLGVEAGQLMVVGVALVALLALRHWRRYPPVVLRGGSVLAMGVASVWLCERVFDLKVLPFS